MAEVRSQFASGHARENAYRPALQRLMRCFHDVEAVNDPKHSEYGAPDFVFQRISNRDVILGYAETKDIDADLDKVMRSEQMHRYAGYRNLFLTNNLEFRFLTDGELVKSITIGDISSGRLVADPDMYERLIIELSNFLASPPEPITSGKRLAEIMGAKTRRIRDDLLDHFADDPGSNDDLVKIFRVMKTMLVSDLDERKFADIYAQTLVYGLFIARYNDTSPDTFTRSEARDLVPQTNPFLRVFFDHIVGASFDVRLARAVDELCEVFRLSIVKKIVTKFVAAGPMQDKDPVVYFYEDFLKAYDSDLREDMGAYYTPVPVVRFIIRQVDRVLREEFGLKGLADSSKISVKIDDGQVWRYRDSKTGKRRKTTGQEVEYHRVQILDPAVGTGTFLSESINFIYRQYEEKKQLGQWPGYVTNDLLPRMHGFELMMAPYTIAHLKIAMTLEAMDVVRSPSQRLGIYLTSALEPGIPAPPDLLSLIGLTEVISEESRLASNVKNDRPLLVLIGNPPYKGESHNNTDFAKSLVENYAFEPGTSNRLEEANYKWINDDYVKFIGLAERQILKNGTGILAMITGNGYLHNPTFRGMRYNLLKNFDKIFLLDLHGSTQKREKTPAGEPDANVFDIKLGVSIIIAVKTSTATALADVYFGDLYGTRAQKFDALNSGKELWKLIEIDPKFYRFSESAPQDIRDEYYGFPSVKDIFPLNSLGILTKRDKLAVGFNVSELADQLETFFDSDQSDQEVCRKFGLQVKDKDTWDAAALRREHSAEKAIESIRDVVYRPFDSRKVAYDPKLVARLNTKVSSQLSGGNYALVVGRQGQAVRDVMWNLVFVVDDITDQNVFGRGGGTLMPLNIHHVDGSMIANAGSDAVRILTKDLEGQAISHGEIFDYVYAILHSPAYRNKYKAFLKTDFPQIPPACSREEFDYFRNHGQRLRELHLLNIEGTLTTTYPVVGSNQVDFYRYREGGVWINDSQMFGNVPEGAWEHYIGGYQPAKKWLKDRKGRQLTNQEIDTYQVMIGVITDTLGIMEELDSYPAWWA